ncbi:MAG: ATP-binding cassette domain-containing protein [Rudaea sp.]|nr:ATP-binding cassette domain-containing protein [Rudaea sp.]
MTQAEAAAAIHLHDLRFGWNDSAPLIDIADLSIVRGERMFLQGPSGSGKSTLLGLLGGVLVPQHGSVTILNTDLAALGGAERDRFRADHIGFIFQQFNLLTFLDVIENVTLACRFSAKRAQVARSRSTTIEAEAARLLQALDLDPAALRGRSARELSMGQQQRVAAARALIGAPEIVIADEPTSALDEDTRTRFLDLLIDECDSGRTTLVFVSHDSRLAPRFMRSAGLADLHCAGAAGGSPDP